MMNIVEPEFMGTNKNPEIQDLFEENLRTPLNNQVWGPEGAVVIQFKVLPTGNLSEFKILNSLTSDYDEAVTATLEATNGMWSPGTINGRPMPMEKKLIIFFKFKGTRMYHTAQINKIKADNLMKEGKYSRAIKFYSRSIESYPICDLTIYRRGISKYYLGVLEGAIHDFERVTDLESHLADPMLAKLNEVSDYANRTLRKDTP